MSVICGSTSVPEDTSNQATAEYIKFKHSISWKTKQLLVNWYTVFTGETARDAHLILAFQRRTCIRRRCSFKGGAHEIY